MVLALFESIQTRINVPERYEFRCSNYPSLSVELLSYVEGIRLNMVMK